MSKLSSGQVQELLQKLQGTLAAGPLVTNGSEQAGAALELLSPTAKAAGLRTAIELTPVQPATPDKVLETLLTLNTTDGSAEFAASLVPAIAALLAAARGAGAWLGQERLTLTDITAGRPPEAEIYGVALQAEKALLQALRPVPFVSSFNPVLGRILAARGSLAAMIEPQLSAAHQSFLSLVFAEAKGALATVPFGGSSVSVYGKPAAVAHIAFLLKNEG